MFLEFSEPEQSIVFCCSGLSNIFHCLGKSSSITVGWSTFSFTSGVVKHSLLQWVEQCSPLLHRVEKHSSLISAGSFQLRHRGWQQLLQQLIPWWFQLPGWQPNSLEIAPLSRRSPGSVRTTRQRPSTSSGVTINYWCTRWTNTHNAICLTNLFILRVCDC